MPEPMSEHFAYDAAHIATPVVFDGTPLTIEAVTTLAHRRAGALLSDAPAFRARITRGMAFPEAPSFEPQHMLDEIQPA